MFTDRSPQVNSSLSSRRPSFNASTFGSPNFVDKTLSTKQILSSPFYSGNTIYGGASAYGRKLVKNAEDANSSKMSIQIKPTNDRTRIKTTGLSKTARKILSVMEQYNTPINDAKKIPITPKRSGILSKYIGATPYMVREKKTYNTELQVPTVPDLLLMKQKERLQNSTESVRQMANKSKSSLNKEEYKLRSDDNTKTHSGKMKAKRSSTRQMPDDLDPVCEVNLAKVPLPITTLPKFDLLLKPLLSTNEKNNNIEKTGLKNLSKVHNVTKALDPKKPNVKEKENGKSKTFVFSDPLIISKSLKPNSAINCFKFSEPLCKKQSIMESHKSQIQTEEIQISKGFGEQVKSSNKRESSSLVHNSQDSSCIHNEPTHKTQLPDSGFGSLFKPANTTWECSTCLIRNNIDLDKCQACGVLRVSTHPPVNSTNCFKSSEPVSNIQMVGDSSKAQSKTSETATSKGFGDQFKMSDKWECGSCLVRNSQSDKNCVACTSARPDSDVKLSDSGFGNKFKPSSSTWECSTCLVRNSKDLDKCQACETAKVTPPSSLTAQPSLISHPSLNNFGDQFKPLPSTWECSTCLIRNQKNSHVCQACGSAQPSGTNFSDKINDKTLNMFSSPTPSSDIFNKVNASESSTNKSSTVPSSIKAETPSTSIIFKVHKMDSHREKINNSLSETEVGNSKDVIFGSELKKTENLFGNKTKENSNVFNSTVSTTPSIIFGSSNSFPTMNNDKLSTTIISDKFSSPKPSTTKVDVATPMFLSNFDSVKQDKPNNLMFKTDVNRTNDFETELKKSDNVFGSRSSETTNFFTASTAAVTNPTFNFNTAAVSTSSTFQFNSLASTSKDTQAPLFKFGSGSIQPPTTSIKPFNGQDVPMSTNLNFSAPATSFSFGNIGKIETPAVASNNIFGPTSNASKNGTFNFGPNANNNTDKAVFTFGASQTGTSQPNAGFAPSNPSSLMFGTQAVSNFNHISN